MAGKDTDKAAAKTPKVRKRRWYHQLWDVYTMTRREEPNITWWLLLIFVGGIAVAAGIGLAIGNVWYLLVLGVPTAFFAAMIFLARRAERAAYSRIEGQPGAVGAALGAIRKGWDVEKDPVAMDLRTGDMVYRAVGRAGVVLVSDGPANRVGKLLETEKRRTARVLANVPVTLLQCGNDEGQIPLRKLSSRVQRLRGKLTAAETSEVSKRLRALGGVRLPVPKGVDPMRARPDRKGMRGR
jgi:hypothetical protein